MQFYPYQSVSPSFNPPHPLFYLSSLQTVPSSPFPSRFPSYLFPLSPFYFLPPFLSFSLPILYLLILHSLFLSLFLPIHFSYHLILFSILPSLPFAFFQIFPQPSLLSLFIFSFPPSPFFLPIHSPNQSGNLAHPLFLSPYPPSLPIHSLLPILFTHSLTSPYSPSLSSPFPPGWVSSLARPLPRTPAHPPPPHPRVADEGGCGVDAGGRCGGVEGDAKFAEKTPPLPPSPPPPPAGNHNVYDDRCECPIPTPTPTPTPMTYIHTPTLILILVLSLPQYH